MSDKNNLKNSINISVENLKQHVTFLVNTDRTSQTGVVLVQNYIKNELKSYKITQVKEQKYKVGDENHENIIVDFESDSKNPTYIVGAHYDACDGNPGADDNASGVAGLLEIARILKLQTLRDRNIQLVFYSTEEPPNFGTSDMGSYHHAESVKDKNIKMVLVYDMIGYFSEDKNSQSFPAPILKYIYPTEGNYIAIVSNFTNFFTNRAIKSGFSGYLSNTGSIGVESINAFNFIAGIDFSDHRNYWKFGIPAVMITDTSFYRNPYYHSFQDTIETLNFEKISQVVGSTIYTILNAK